jgi:hypothetical protein
MTTNRKGTTIMKRILITAALIGALSAPAQACSNERWNYLIVGAAKANQVATAAQRYRIDYPQDYIDAVQTFTEWAAAVQECEAERQANNLQ